VRFKLDENLPVELLEDLRAAGHEANGLRDEDLIGASDDVVLDLVRRERRVLLTLDRGIADAIRPRPTRASSCSDLRQRVVAPPSCSCDVTSHLSSNGI
jgi:predicted nuclease of predicted toxin-antitoxin system